MIQLKISKLIRVTVIFTVYLTSVVYLSHKSYADSPTNSSEALSYEALATAKIKPIYKTILKKLMSVNSQSMPHELKVVRKELAVLREYVDVFVFAFPSDRESVFVPSADVGAQNDNPWVSVRNTLDEGYEKVGSFKDLFDIQGLVAVDDNTPDSELSKGTVRISDIKYTDKKLLEKRRAVVLNWLKEFLDPQFQDQAEALFNSPREGISYKHSLKELSKFSWGGVESRPQAGEVGYRAVHRLLKGHAIAALNEYDEVVDLRDPAKSSKTEEQFHDFRKRIRALSRLVDLFEGLVATEQEKADIALAGRFASEFGEIGDQITALIIYEDNNETKKAEKKHEKIDEMWKATRRSMDQTQFKNALERLAKS